VADSPATRHPWPSVAAAWAGRRATSAEGHSIPAADRRQPCLRAELYQKGTKKWRASCMGSPLAASHRDAKPQAANPSSSFSVFFVMLGVSGLGAFLDLLDVRANVRNR